MAVTYERVNDLSEVRERRPTSIAIGVFDGVHLGHQHLLRSMVAEARSVGLRTAVLTFFPHPKVVIRNIEGRVYLTRLERRVELLGALGIDLIIVHPFDDRVRQTRAAAFVDQLDRHVGLGQIWGGGFSLGYQREGTFEFLSELGSERGFTVHQIDELVQWKGEPVSSSRIRRALAAGDIEDVNGCLGRPFAVSGEVIMGDQRGRTIGFPTANLAVWNQQLLPANGVYATFAQLEDERHLAATNVGVRPTVADPRLAVEAYLLGFDREIYGQTLSLDFISRIRDERKFNGLEALQAQIAADVAEVSERLGR